MLKLFKALKAGKAVKKEVLQLDQERQAAIAALKNLQKSF